MWVALALLHLQPPTQFPAVLKTICRQSYRRTVNDRLVVAEDVGRRIRERLVTT